MRNSPAQAGTAGYPNIPINKILLLNAEMMCQAPEQYCSHVNIKKLSFYEKRILFPQGSRSVSVCLEFPPCHIGQKITRQVQITCLHRQVNNWMS